MPANPMQAHWFYAVSGARISTHVLDGGCNPFVTHCQPPCNHSVIRRMSDWGCSKKEEEMYYGFGTIATILLVLLLLIIIL